MELIEDESNIEFKDKNNSNVMAQIDQDNFSQFDDQREQWSNKVEYMLSVVGYVSFSFN